MGLSGLVLAGRPYDGRFGPRARIGWESLVPVGGRPMVHWIVEALLAVDGLDALVVVGPPDLVVDLCDPRIRVVAPGTGLFDNVRRGLDALEPLTGEIIVAAADAPLVRPGHIAAFLERARAQGADLCYPVVRRQVCERAFPGVQRTWVKLRDGSFTGGNIFRLTASAARPAATAGEALLRLRKSPLRLARTVGLWFLVRYLLRRVTLLEVQTRFSRVLGVGGCAVEVDDPEIGVDVDKPTDLVLVERVLHERRDGDGG